MTTINRSFLTRTAARSLRSNINAKAKAAGAATLRDPVKDNAGFWIFPGISHGSKLKTPAGIMARIQRG